MNRRHAVHNITAWAAWVGSASLLTACTQRPGFASTDITGAGYALGFTATDHNGQTRTLKDFAGKVVVLFFGYVQCPDVCPIALTELADVKAFLSTDYDSLQVLFCTVDPERDTPALLKAYVVKFDPSFIGLRVEPDKLTELAQHYQVHYKKIEHKVPVPYTMDHSDGHFVYDTQGRIRLKSQTGNALALAGDIKLLLHTHP
jgi:protein SCO1